MRDDDSITSRRSFLLLLFISLMPGRAAVADNLLVNPGFENGWTTGWTQWGCTLMAVQDPVRTGRYSLLASNRTQTWQGPVQSIRGVLEDGKSYTISGWVRLQNASEDKIALTISQADSDGTHYHGVSSSTGYNDRWILLSGSFTLNVTGMLSALNVYFEGPAPGVNFYLDDAEIVAIELPEPEATGGVDMGTVYQELEGFGAAGAWYEGWLTSHPLKNEIYDVLFAQLGLDIYRLRNTYDINSDYITSSAEIVAAAESSLGYPIKIMISSWSPPAYLKSNASTTWGTLSQSARGGGYEYHKFATWWADGLVEYARHGIIANYVNIQNEPDFLTDWDTCKFLPAETTEWAGYNLAFEAVYQELASRMPDMPKLLAAEACGCGASQAYIDALIDPNHAYGYAHHLYADGDFDNPDSFISAMENFGARYGDKPLFQTEYSCDTDAKLSSGALNLACHMHNSLVHEGVCSYFYWNLFWGEEAGLVTLDNPWQPNPGYTINPIYYAFKQYAAFTDPGWHRVEAWTDSTGLRLSAFMSPAADELTIVIINVSSIEISLSLALGDFSPKEAGVFRTSETELTAYAGAFDPSQPLMLPAQTITTISLKAATQRSSRR